LPNTAHSGLIEAMNVLQGVDGIRFQFFDEKDVVRHQLVQRIVRAYEEFRARDDRQLTLHLDADGVATAQEPALAATAKKKATVTVQQ
jgi:phosphate starvation-inducible PhoH-like protein